MYAICVESSHQRGMGHFYRALNFIDYLSGRGLDSILLINDHKPSLSILKKSKINHEVVDLFDRDSGWEQDVVTKYSAEAWINDRLDTEYQHAQTVKQTGVKLVTFDDRGKGASLADLHFAPLIFGDIKELGGARICCGTGYLILSGEIDQYRHLRQRQDSVIVTLGGSDTYGATLKVVKILAESGRSMTVVAGPAFEHKSELISLVTPSIKVIDSVGSLIQYFSNFDLAVTGGGVTPFEANASGLPCIVIANEWFEEPVCEYLQGTGGAVYAGPCDNIDEDILSKSLDIESMSRAAMAHINTGGAERVYHEIESL